MKIISPYSKKNLVLRGTLHAHTTNSVCGHYPLERVISDYSEPKQEFDFIAITDHVCVTDVSGFNNDESLIVFSGVEFKDKWFQTLGINIKKYEDNPKDFDNHQKIFDEVNSQGGINIICHPHIYKDDYWPVEKLIGLKNYLGIEIYNHNMRMNNAGNAVAADSWDALLSAGKIVWGFAGDDMHLCSRIGGGSIYVNSSERRKEEILKSLIEGNFYASTGIQFNNIELNKNKITIELDDVSAKSSIVNFAGLNGKILSRLEKQKYNSFTVRNEEKYIRAEAFRRDGSWAWTQPFIICGDA